MPFIKRADVDNIEKVFRKFASVEKNGVHYMTYNDFVVNFLKLYPSENPNLRSIDLVGKIANTSNEKLISFEEFHAFEGILCRPDAMYMTAFLMFDKDNDGYIHFDEFRDVISATTLYEHIPFNFNCSFTKLHFGENLDRVINYIEFSQIIQDFHEEYAIQAFQRFDKNKNGLISARDFNQIIRLLKRHLLTPYTSKALVTVSMSDDDKIRQVSFPYFTAFVTLLNNMELVKKVFLTRTRGDRHIDISKEELLNEAQHYTHLTPLEVEILFRLMQQRRNDGRVSYSDLCVLAPLPEDRMSYQLQATVLRETVENQVEEHGGRNALVSVMESVYRFGLGSVAGACGATAVYPIDLVKTRMQNQRSGSVVGEILYKNSWDCFKKVLKFEGFAGLYRGLPPQVLGVAPEKAIKLTMNDFMKDQFTDPATGNIALWAEILAGGVAGASQVVFTNPLEIVKIRLQVAGEIASQRRISAFSVIKELGFVGLYKGSRACFLRDIPFSAIYFSLYSHLKTYFAGPDGYNSYTSLLCAATLSGAPAASLVTPADVIKTRLQVKARTGQTTYTGVIDAARKIWAEEGFRAFWKGAPARVFRSSPQFGVTLVVYEMLQRVFEVDFGGRKLAGKGSVALRPEEQLPINPYHIGGYKLASSTFEGVEKKFGICLPKFEPAPEIAIAMAAAATKA